MPKRECGDFGNVDAHILGMILKDNLSIQEVNISRNVVGLEGLKSLCKGLENNHTVTHLDISNNFIGPECAPVILDLLEKNKCIKFLNISNNNIE